MKFFVNIEGKGVEIEVERGEGGLAVTLDGKTLHADLVRIGTSPVYSLTLGGRSYEFSAHRRNGSYEIVLDGEPYSAGVLDERAMLIAEATGGPGDAEGGESVVAPMPGVVVGVSVEEGAAVEPGQGVVTLEAMKMENELKCETGGLVKKVRVAVGQGVSQGEVLVVIE